MHIQRPLFTPNSQWSAPKLSELPSWKGIKRIGLDTETKDSDIKKLGPGVRRPGNFIAGISFAIEDGKSYYLPIQHSEDNLDQNQVLSYIKDNAKVFDGVLVGANLSYDLDWLMQYGIEFNNTKWFRDVQVAEPLINELHFSYSLENILTRHGFPGKEEELLNESANIYKLDAKKDMWALPARYVGQYAEADAVKPLQLLRRQERIIEEQELWDVYNLESELLPVLVNVRRRGVKIDKEHLSRVEDYSYQKEAECLEEIRKETGITVKVGDVWKAGPLAMVLESQGVKVPKTAKTGKPSITKDFLDSLTNVPIAEKIKEARGVNKLRTTFAKSMRDRMIGDRIHCNFNQLRGAASHGNGDDEKGARFGRMSSSQPNLQQQPSGKPYGELWRSIFIPDEGKQWLCADYSGQEPRMGVHFAEKAGCRGAKEAGDRYRQDPNTDSHSMMARIVYGLSDEEVPTKEQRTNSKTTNLGIMYNMTGATLADQYGLPTEYRINKKTHRYYRVAGQEAQNIIDRFDKAAPWVRELQKRTEKIAIKRGYIRTLLGRRCRFPLEEDGKNYKFTQNALNRLIQGSSGDQTKKALIEIEKAGHCPQLQIHDEIDSSITGQKQAEEIGEIMRECVKLTIPTKVDLEIGPSWGQIK